MVNTHKFAIVGCGAIARLHAKAIQAIEGVTLVGVYDYLYTYAENFAKEFSCKAYKTLEELLANPEIEVVNICTPSGRHAEQVIAAAEAKKHIIVEKPMAITKEQLDKVVAVIQKNGVKAEIVTQLRFTPSVRKLKKAIEDGRLGKILLADCSMKYYRSPEYYKQGGWRGSWEMDGGGALMNQGIHGIDLIQYLVGGVKSVYAQCNTLARDIEVEDTANILVEYQNGAMGVIQSTTVANPGRPRRITICGTKGTVVIKEDIIERWDVEGDKECIIQESAFSFETSPIAFSEEYHKLQIMDLIEAIEQNRAPLVDEAEGRKPVDIILAAYESNREDKKVYLK